MSGYAYVIHGYSYYGDRTTYVGPHYTAASFASYSIYAGYYHGPSSASASYTVYRNDGETVYTGPGYSGSKYIPDVFGYGSYYAPPSYHYGGYYQGFFSDSPYFGFSYGYGSYGYYYSSYGYYSYFGANYVYMGPCNGSGYLSQNYGASYEYGYGYSAYSYSSG